MPYLADFLRTQAQKTASWIAQKVCSKEVREEPGVSAKKKKQKTKNKTNIKTKKKKKLSSRNIKRLLLIKEKADIPI